jgi:hypothetical protein
MKLYALVPIGLSLLAATASADTAVYDLDAKNAKEVSEAIGRVLTAQCASGPKDTVSNQAMCRAELLPTGQLLVEAPAASQAQVAAVLKTIAARNAGATPRVTLQYWVLYGEPGKPDAADASLKPLNPVLQQLERVHGELGFSVQDTASITTQSGTSAIAGGGPLQINQRVHASGDAVDLAAQISFTRAPLSQSLNVTVTIKRGEFLVLGERTASEPGKPDKAEQSDKSEKLGTLFYVVHWPQGQ